MQSFNTKFDNCGRPALRGSTIIVGRVEDVPPGRCVTVELSDGRELALYNVEGEFHATDNFCPHKGAPLAEGTLCGHTIECGWHGWQFDVRTGQCLITSERVEVYRVVIEEEVIKIEV